MYRSTKTYGNERGLSCAFRQWRADSHCNLIHGYSLGFVLHLKLQLWMNEIGFMILVIVSGLRNILMKYLTTH